MGKGSDDDADGFVRYGTQLEPLSDDDNNGDVYARAPKSKKKKEEGGSGSKGLHLVQNQIVTDEQGRRRFHGAFSGGFSAGYYNTVGSEDGWAPQTFVSSRDNRFDRSKTQRPEDYMDAEDLGEFGIAPQTLRATSTFATSETRQGFKRSHGDMERSDPLVRLWEGMIAPVSESVGAKLLKKMGWRQGWGIGPRANVTMTVRGMEGEKWDEESSSDEETTKSKGRPRVRLAPRDVQAILMEPKLDTKGLGFSGIDVSGSAGDRSVALIPPEGDNSAPKDDAMGHVNLFGLSERVVGSAERKVKKKGIRGHAFGIGAFEEEDEDIYAVENINKYDFDLGGEENDPLHGWTAPENKSGRKSNLNSAQVDALLSQVQSATIISGFQRATQNVDHRPRFFSLKVPKGFKAYHVFPTSKKKRVEESSFQPNLPIQVRSALLGESLSVGPEKTILNNEATKSSRWGQETGAAYVAKDKEKMSTISPSSPMSSENSSGDTSAAPKTPIVSKSSKPSFVSSFVCASGAPGPSSPIVKSPLVIASQSSSGSFSPFTSDASKNSRYVAYLNRKKSGEKNPYRGLAPSSMTEWEKEREREEFQHASIIYRPMNNTMASRFVAARFDDEEDDNSVTKDEHQDMKNAVKMNQFGPVTRSKVEWRPERILCKRFNVPNPFPDGVAAAGNEPESESKPASKFFMKDLFADLAPRKNEGTAAMVLTAPTTPAIENQARIKETIKPSSSLTQKSIEDESGEPEDNAESEIDASDDLITRHLKTKRTEVAKIAIKLKTTKAFIPPTPCKPGEAAVDVDVAKPERDLFKAVFESDESSDDENDDEDDIEEKAKNNDDNKDENATVQKLAESKKQVEPSLPSETRTKMNKLLEKYACLDNGGVASNVTSDIEYTSNNNDIDLPIKITFSYSKTSKSCSDTKQPSDFGGSQSFPALEGEMSKSLSKSDVDDDDDDDQINFGPSLPVDLSSDQSWQPKEKTTSTEIREKNKKEKKKKKKHKSKEKKKKERKKSKKKTHCSSDSEDSSN